MTLPGTEHACVLWNTPVSPVLAYRHFRGLNQARIPLAPGDRDEETASADEVVLFRHRDPSVLGLIGPLLPPPQQARLFGPLTGVTFHWADGGHVM